MAVEKKTPTPAKAPPARLLILALLPHSWGRFSEYLQLYSRPGDIVYPDVPLARTGILLTAIIAGNALVRVFGKRAGLTQGELVLLYIMLTLSTAIGGVGMVQFLVPTSAAPFYFATRENGWGRVSCPLSPPGSPCATRRCSKASFQGHSTLYDQGARAWASPEAPLVAFLMVLILSMPARGVPRAPAMDRSRASLPSRSSSCPCRWATDVPYLAQPDHVAGLCHRGDT